MEVTHKPSQCKIKQTKHSNPIAYPATATERGAVWLGVLEASSRRRTRSTALTKTPNSTIKSSRLRIQSRLNRDVNNKR